LNIEGNVIIVDEAHNLGKNFLFFYFRVFLFLFIKKPSVISIIIKYIVFQLPFFYSLYLYAADAINGSHSAALHASTAETAHCQLAAYFDRFRTQLAPVNAKNVQALMRAADALAKSAGGGAARASQAPSSAAAAAAKAVTVNDFLFSTGLDNVNMFQLVRHVKQSKAVFKVAGFYQALQRRTAAAADDNTTNDNNNASEGATGSLHALLSFLQALTNNDTDGRVVSDPSSGTVKFVLLNAAAHFASVVSSARAVVLASGTLSPLETVLDLFPSVSKHDIHKFCCGHVVGKERLLAVAVGAGPGGTALDFRHGSRGSDATIDELGRLVLNTCNAAPGGVVVFFPSFSYADQVHARWATSGMLRTLGEKKKVFREPRTAGEVDSVLEEYATCIKNSSARNTTTTVQNFGSSSQTVGGLKKNLTGAVMLCVVGGKLAEGINFGDDLGRCVIMVGLPYPNPSDPELQERLRFVDRNSSNSKSASALGGGNNNNKGTAASREYYSNLCMKAVNQCIGRAIRHRRDYAAVLLVDVRYAGTTPLGGGSGGNGGGSGDTVEFTGVLAKLPGWIQQSLVACPKFGDAYGRLVRFYKGMAAAAVAEEAAVAPAEIQVDNFFAV
jgi:chromosome transmission fidelity protein 1